MIEEWRDIKDYEGLYQVSNLGRVRNTNYRNSGKIKVLKGHIDRYNRVHFCGNTFGVHILVAQAFPEICGEWYKESDVHHKDGNQLNNNVNNLIVLSKTEHHSLHLSKCVLQYTLDGEFIKKWDSAPEIERELGFHKENINDCCIGKIKQSHNYLWIREGEENTIPQRVNMVKINGNSKPVYQYTLDGEFIAEYSSQMEVERQLGYDQAHISNCCLGRIKSAYGFIWSNKKIDNILAA